MPRKKSKPNNGSPGIFKVSTDIDIDKLLTHLHIYLKNQRCSKVYDLMTSLYKRTCLILRAHEILYLGLTDEKS